jgi:hypothetical protein
VGDPQSEDTDLGPDIRTKVHDTYTTGKMAIGLVEDEHYLFTVNAATVYYVSKLG